MLRTPRHRGTDIGRPPSASVTFASPPATAERVMSGTIDNFWQAYHKHSPRREREPAWQVSSPQNSHELARNEAARRAKLHRLINVGDLSAAARAMEGDRGRRIEDVCDEVAGNIEKMTAQRRQLSESRRRLERALGGPRRRREATSSWSMVQSHVKDLWRVSNVIEVWSPALSRISTAEGLRNDLES